MAHKKAKRGRRLFLLSKMSAPVAVAIGVVVGGILFAVGTFAFVRYETWIATSWIGHSQTQLLDSLKEPTEKMQDGSRTVFLYRKKLLLFGRWTGVREAALEHWFAIDAQGIIRDAGWGRPHTKKDPGYHTKPE